MAMMRNETKAKTRVPPASPSRPSVRFTPLVMATIAKAANTMYRTGEIPTAPTNGTAIASIE